MNQEVKDFGLALAHSQAILALAQAKMKNQCKHTTALEIESWKQWMVFQKFSTFHKCQKAPQYSSGLDKELKLKAGD
jgi:hypothetical protein